MIPWFSILSPHNRKEGHSPLISNSPTSLPHLLLPSSIGESSPIKLDLTASHSEFDPAFSFNKELQTFLASKRVPVNESPVSIDELALHHQHGYLQFEPGLLLKNNSLICARCGNKDPELFASYQCARCGETCSYCRQCLMMGVIKACTPLIRWTGPPLEWAKSSVQELLPHPPKLTPLQKQASEAVKQAIREKTELLVWAVCGAGKTELLFEGLAEALASGQTIALATPRTDVVLELVPRLKAAFPKVNLMALYGGSDDRGKQGQLVVTTTHQLLRYYQAFDSIIIDEIDAFPFSTDSTLHHAVEQARNNYSSKIILTATPDATLKKLFFSKKLAGVLIPRRFHGYPLPRPLFKWEGNWKKEIERGDLPSSFARWLERQRSAQRPCLIFVPSITVLNQLTKVLQNIDPMVAGVHAEDPERVIKVAQFRNGERALLVTTTILERGITIPHLDVAVLGSEDRIFTESALVQIAGRVGRAADDPYGEVVFFHYGKTEAMLAAVRHIDKMNN